MRVEAIVASVKEMAVIAALSLASKRPGGAWRILRYAGRRNKRRRREARGTAGRRVKAEMAYVYGRFGEKLGGHWPATRSNN